jgi:hypothetical protein
MDFSSIKAITIPEGEAVKIECGGAVLWEKVVVPSYKNWVKYSTEADGTTVYNNGLGYKDGYRLSSSGVEKVGDNYMSTTGYIPAKGGDVIRIGGVSWYSGTGNAQNYLCAYDSSFNYIGSIYGQAGGYYTKKIHSSYELTPSLSTIVLADNSSIAYIRINCRDNSKPGGISGANMIVTVNEEIPI